MDKLWWFVINILAILLQIGFGIAGAVCITSAGQQGRNDVLNFNIGNFVNNTNNITNALYPATVLGFVAAVFNAALLFLLHRADKTTGKQVHFHRKTITVVGVIVCTGFVIGDIVIAGVLQGKFPATTALAVIAGVALAAAVGADIFKLVTFDRQDAKEDHDMRDLQQRPV